MDNQTSFVLRQLPCVNNCLAHLAQVASVQSFPSMRLKHCVRLYLEQTRRDIIAGHLSFSSGFDLDRWFADLVQFTLLYHRLRFTQVINATGVIVHTNLGRSILPDSAIASLQVAASGYSNLELDLYSGRRGSRYSHVEELLCELTGAEAALVVNNNAAAVLIALETLAKEREVVVSRGQLVEIGGSFRIPDIMARSGARLIEVGSTNRTHEKDYESALSAETALLLRVHCSNFRVIGFTSEVAAHDLVRIGRKHGIAVMEDLGSGSLVDFSRFGLTKEPTVQEVVASGMDIVTFSGDKLLGGPQAGIIVGGKQYVDRIKHNPLNRALRIDKLTLASLESVLRLYLDESQAIREIPTLSMIATPESHIHKRATRFCERCKATYGDICSFDVVQAHSQVGGGALPEQNLASWAVSLQPQRLKVSRLEKRLRAVPVPVVGRVENDCLLFDMRTVAENEEDVLLTSLGNALCEVSLR